MSSTTELIVLPFCMVSEVRWNVNELIPLRFNVPLNMK